ncbi:MAG: 2-oxoacid:acceptor oxidoreductase family protein, partial [Notoacmeibacter sp.]|nr:2-oxoacid:acceptor oxidoreductase family protein [Notoacmeibacter sp.]
MAAHLEGKGCGMIDMAGLAQKGGAVFSHVRIARTPQDIHSIRVSAGKADLILGCDLVVSGAGKVLSAVREGETIFVANTAEVMPGDFARSPDFSLPVERLKRAIRKAAGEDKAHFFDATRTATTLFGNSVGANMFMLGFAYQHGGVPVSAEAVEEAIRLNGQAVNMNIEAFRWGRRAAHEPEFVQSVVDEARGRSLKGRIAATLDEVIRRRADFLTGYQNAAYSARYLSRVEQVREAEGRVSPGSEALTETVARNLFKLMAIKDEYEVGRLYSGRAFRDQLGREFSSWEKLEYHLAPPILARRDDKGHLKKSAFGPWMSKVFGLLASLRGLRGTVFDVFGHTAERRMERGLLRQYEQDLALVLSRLSDANLADAVTLASIPSQVRGFGHIKEANVKRAESERAAVMERFTQNPDSGTLKAAE